MGTEKHDRQVAGLILASGLSRRFGTTNKLLLPVEGEPVVRRVAATFVRAGLGPVLVVVGHEANAVRRVLRGLPLEVVENPEFEEGQSRALVRGVAALPASVTAAVIGVADQPFLQSQVIRLLVEAFRRGPASMVAPRYGGQRGNPVLFGASLFPELLGVEGDQGGRNVLAAHPDEVAWVDFDDIRIGMDIDTEEAYRAIARGDALPGANSG